MSRAIVLPKPILKSHTPTPTGTPCHSVPKHAHFPPPSKEVAQRFSGIEYDRSPIVVIENECALPERGCPGRTFDGTVDMHHYVRHNSKKSSRSSETHKSVAMSDHVHPNYFAAVAAVRAAAAPPATTADMTMPMDLAYCPGPMPSLAVVHTDTDESSDGDVSSPFSESTLLPESISRKAEAGRLRKSQHPSGTQRASSVRAHRHDGNRLHRTIDFPPPSPSSTFESCPGTNSCLGGF